jgi:geranylgeranyl pyrophosphate synthase
MSATAESVEISRDPQFQALLERWQGRIERELTARLPPATARPTRLHEALRYSALGGGKRVRPVLVYATASSLGIAEANVDGVACAVELIHAYSLVHDDLPCMDDDDLRRGKPTVHRAFDEATAVLAGDALQPLAFELLAGDPALAISAARKLQMIDVLARASGSIGMAGGQAMDLASVGGRMTPDELRDCYARKTGALIAASVRLGTLAAESAEATRVQALHAYGDAIGLAFQIADDVLDVESDTATLGKRAGADEARGKPTYPSVIGLQAAKDEAARLHRLALESLSPLGDNAQALAAIADFVVARRR